MALKKELRRIDPEIFANLMRSHYDYLATLLEEAAKEYWRVNPVSLI